MEKPLLETVPSNKSIISILSSTNPFISIPIFGKSDNDVTNSAAVTDDYDIFSTTSDMTWSADGRDKAILDTTDITYSKFILFAIGIVVFIVTIFCIYLIIMVLVRKA